MIDGINVIHTGPLGVNTYIVPLCGSNVMIIDPGSCRFSQDEKAITMFLTSHQLHPVAIVLTHGHFDHVAGLVHLKIYYPSAPVLIHPEDKQWIGLDSQLMQGKNLSLMGLDSFLPSVTRLPQADDYLKDGFNLGNMQCFLDDLQGLEIDQATIDALNEWKIIHTPGHSAGSICLYNATRKELITGDTLFYKNWGRTDLPGGSEDAIHRSLARLRNMIPGDTLVYPGHDEYGFRMADSF